VCILHGLTLDTPMSSDSLPLGWTRYTTDDGEEYFYNEVTEQTQWDRPTQPATARGVRKQKKNNKREKGEYVPIDAGALMDEGFEGTEEDKQKEIPSRGPIKYDVPMVDFSSGSKDTHEVEGNRSSDRSKILNLDGQLDSAPKRSAAGSDAAATSSSSSEVSGGWLLSKLTCGLTLSYIQDNFFDVTSRDVEGRLLLAIWPYRLSLLSPSSSLQLPSPGSTGSPEGGRVAQFFTRHFADSIQLLSSFRTNPDLWGPFWICTTAVIFLTATANFSRQLLSGAKQGEVHTTDYTLAGTAWLVLFGVVILAPLITLGLLLWITSGPQQRSGNDETGWWDRLPAWLRPATTRHNTYVIDDAATNDGGSYAVPPAHGQQGGAKASLWLLLTSSYGYSVAVMLPLSILWMVPWGWVKSLACGLGFLTSMVFIYVSLLRTGGVDGASGASPVLQRLGVADPSQKVCVEVAMVTAAVAIVMEGGMWASCRFAEIPLPGGVYYDKEKGEYCNRFSDEKAAGASLFTLLTTSPHTFFERYLLIITAEDELLGYFSNLALNDNHEVLAFIQGASRATKCYGDDGNPVTAPGNSKVVGHRRVLWMQREEEKIDGYFSEGRMRRRDAGLWHSVVGKFDTEKGGAKLIDAVDDAEYSAADEEGKREMRKSYIVDQMEAHLHDGSIPHKNPRLEPLADDFITESIDLADFDAEAADCREERVQALRKTMQARFLDGRDGRFIDYTEIDEDEDLDAFISRELEMDIQEKYFDESE
ncbi:hypothetical protein FOZ62_012148, partial [Perkinsus olseni]